MNSQSKDLARNYFIFEVTHVLPWCLIAFYVAFFTAAIVYIWKNRREASFRTRSPKIIVFSFALMMLDCVLNTIMLMEGKSKFESPWYLQCRIGVLATVICQFSYFAIYFSRMYRVSQVYKA
jgi:hypothetical protein